MLLQSICLEDTLIHIIIPTTKTHIKHQLLTLEALGGMKSWGYIHPLYNTAIFLSLPFGLMGWTLFPDHRQRRGWYRKWREGLVVCRIKVMMVFIPLGQLWSFGNVISMNIAPHISCVSCFFNGENIYVFLYIVFDFFSC